MPKLKHLKAAMIKEVGKGLWEKQDWLLAWLVVEVYEVHLRVNFRLERLVSKVLPLKQKLLQLMTNEEFLSTHLLKRSMEEKVTILLEFEVKSKQGSYNQSRAKRNDCENRTEYLNVINQELKSLQMETNCVTRK